ERALSAFVGRSFRGRALHWIAAAALLLGCRSEAAPTSTVYAVTKAGALYRSTDGAATWQQVPLAGVPAGTFSSWLGVDPAGNISLTLDQAAVGKGSPTGGLLRALYRSVDGGQTWSKTELPPTVSTRLALDPT